MGRTFVTFEDAAKLLKCSKRTVHNYVKKGLLRKDVEDGEVVLRREDVEQLADGLGSNLPALTNRTLLELLGRLKTLEMKVAVFQKMHGIEEHQPLRPSPEEALKLVGMAEWYLQKKDFTSPEIQLWVSTFQRMDELTFQMIRDSGAKTDFWRDLFDLCLHLMDFVSNPKKCKETRTWLAHHLELNECRKSLRTLILMWVELNRESSIKAVHRYLSGGKEDLARRLAGN
jgi:DNA-binding transcriptional MerR regulator